MANGTNAIGMDEVKAARSACGLTQAEVAPIVYTSIDNWQNWEQGRHTMRAALFELFLLKTGQITLRDFVSGAEYAVMRLRPRIGRVIDISLKNAVIRDIAIMAASNL